MSNPWEYIAPTPAHGKCYYNSVRDIVVVVYHHLFKVYSDRVRSGYTPSCFSSVRLYGRACE